MCPLQHLGRITYSHLYFSSNISWNLLVPHSTLVDALWMAAFHWDKHIVRSHHASPQWPLYSVLLALSPPRWACWGLPCAFLEPRSSLTDVSMCANDLQRAEVTQLAAPVAGETEQSCLCRFPISLFPQGSPPRLISMHKMDGSYRQNNTRATVLLGEIPEAALCEP